MDFEASDSGIITSSASIDFSFILVYDCQTMQNREFEKAFFFRVDTKIKKHLAIHFLTMGYKGHFFFPMDLLFHTSIST